MQITPPSDNPNAPTTKSITQANEEVQQLEQLEPYPRIDPAKSPEQERPRRDWRKKGERRLRSAQQSGDDDRRRRDRRQVNVPVMLDTRSNRERRTLLRRDEDRIEPKHYPRLRGVNILV